MDIEVINKKVWLNQKEATFYTGICRSVLDDLRKNGLKYSKVQGKILYKRTNIDKFIEENEIKNLEIC